MKRITVLFLLLGTWVLTYSQESVICGKFSNEKGKTFFVYKTRVPDKKWTSEIDSLGKFHLTVPCTEEGFYTFGDGREVQTIYIHPDDSIYVTLNTKYFDETARFSGKGATESNILIRFFMIGELSKSENPVTYKEIFQTAPKALFNRIKEIQDIKLALLNDYQKDTIVSKKFIETEKEIIVVETLSSLLQLKYGYQRYNRLFLPLYTDSLQNSSIFSNIPYDTTLFSRYDYQNVMNSFISHLAEKEFKSDSLFYKNKSYGLNAARVKVIMNNKAFTPDFRDYCLFNEANHYLSENYTFETLPAYATDFKKNCRSEYLKKKIEEKINQNKLQLENFSKEDSSLLHDRKFLSFTRSYFYNQAMNSLRKKGNEITNESYLKEQMNIINDKVSSNLLKNWLYFTLTRNYLARAGSEYNKDIVKQFKKNCRSKTYKKKIDETVNNLNRLLKGMPAPDFTGVDINGKEHTLSNYKGRFVYIDIWATWCSPCRHQIPYLDKLRKEYKDKNIVFISISIDDDKEKWATMVKNDKMQGIQLYAPEAWKSDITKAYAVSFIPRFILVDDAGKIVTDNAPRPSGKIRETLDKYLSNKQKN